MSHVKKRAGWTLLVLIVLAAAAFAISWRPAIKPLDKATLLIFPAEQIARGKTLAALGDCAVCHTRPGGERNSGGLPMKIPFGTIYTSNITPDKETGIGLWSYDAFVRAMRHGVDQQGNYLYPAFPYTAFTRTRDEDLQALYAYLMSQPAVHYQPPRTALAFPFNIRQGIWLWNLRYLTTGPEKTHPDRSAEWNRGAYLTEGLGHCSACHSPRDLFYGEKSGEHHLTGGEAENWSAPALRGNNALPVAWSAEDLMDFMRTGYSARHGVAAGPMRPVIEEGLSTLSDADRRAIATYLASWIALKHSPQAGRDIARQSDKQTTLLASEGARLYSGACMACHAQTKGAAMPVRPALALNTNLYADQPDNAIRVVLDGIQHPATASLGSMPGFRHNLNDRQIAVLLNYLRQTFTRKAPWPDLEPRVAALRAEKQGKPTP